MNKSCISFIDNEKNNQHGSSVLTFDKCKRTPKKINMHANIDTSTDVEHRIVDSIVHVPVSFFKEFCAGPERLSAQQKLFGKAGKAGETVLRAW